MNWEEATQASTKGIAISIIKNSLGIRVVNKDGEVWGRERKNDTMIFNLACPGRSRGRIPWIPYGETTKETLLETYEVEFVRSVFEVVSFARKEIRMALPVKPCDLHNGQRGLQTLLKEWTTRISEIKVGAEQLNGNVDFANPNLADMLDEIITNATKMREIL